MNTTSAGHPAIRAPKSATTHQTSITVRAHPSWKVAIQAAAPQTPVGNEIMRVGSRYRSREASSITKQLVMINFPRGKDKYKKAMAWSARLGLKPSSPRTVFALAEERPDLLKATMSETLFAVSPQECAVEGDLRICGVQFTGGRCEAGLGWLAHAAVYGPTWFVFEF